MIMPAQHPVPAKKTKSLVQVSAMRSVTIDLLIKENNWALAGTVFKL
jgi:hypothetical protein